MKYDRLSVLEYNQVLIIYWNDISTVYEISNCDKTHKLRAQEASWNKIKNVKYLIPKIMTKIERDILI